MQEMFSITCSTRWVGIMRGRAARFCFALQFGNPLLQLLNHRLKLGDDGNENIAVDGGQLNFNIHALYMT